MGSFDDVCKELGKLADSADGETKKFVKKQAKILKKKTLEVAKKRVKKDSGYYHKSIKDGKPYLCVRIKGHSMAPSILDGGYLVIRKLETSEWESIRDNYVYVVCDTEGKTYVKRLKNRLRKHGFIVCMSDNADKLNYPNFNIYEEELHTVWYAKWYFSAKIPNAGRAIYSAAKSGVSSLTRSAAAEYAPFGIRVVGIVPGMIETEISRENISKNRALLQMDSASQRLGVPEDLAQPMVFLASDACGYITGVDIEISGGKFCVQKPQFPWETAGIQPKR